MVQQIKALAMQTRLLEFEAQNPDWRGRTYSGKLSSDFISTLWHMCTCVHTQVHTHACAKPKITHTHTEVDLLRRWVLMEMLTVNESPLVFLICYFYFPKFPILLSGILINGFEFNELKYTRFVTDFTHTILDTSKKNINYTLHYIICFKN